MVKVPAEARVLADKAVKQLALPSAYLRLRQAMGKMNSSLADMSAVVARDPMLLVGGLVFQNEEGRVRSHDPVLLAEVHDLVLQLLVLAVQPDLVQR